MHHRCITRATNSRRSRLANGEHLDPNRMAEPRPAPSRRAAAILERRLLAEETGMGVVFGLLTSLQRVARKVSAAGAGAVEAVTPLADRRSRFARRQTAAATTDASGIAT